VYPEQLLLSITLRFFVTIKQSSDHKKQGSQGLLGPHYFVKTVYRLKMCKNNQANIKPFKATNTQQDKTK
jgi:hypothetical protein